MLLQRAERIQLIVLIEGVKTFASEVIDEAGIGKFMVEYFSLISCESTNSARPVQFLKLLSETMKKFELA